MTKSEATVFIDDLKKRFPQPVSVHEDNGGGNYCIGGAVCELAGRTSIEEVGFPGHDQITMALIRLNPALLSANWDWSVDTAAAIIMNNDSGRMEAAYDVLHAALCYRPDNNLGEASRHVEAIHAEPFAETHNTVADSHGDEDAGPVTEEPDEEPDEDLEEREEPLEVEPEDDEEEFEDLDEEEDEEEECDDEEEEYDDGYDDNDPGAEPEYSEAGCGGGLRALSGCGS